MLNWPCAYERMSVFVVSTESLAGVLGQYYTMKPASISAESLQEFGKKLAFRAEYEVSNGFFYHKF